MPLAACLLQLTLQLAVMLAGSAVRADVGGTLSMQTDARERGLSYSGHRPTVQLGLAWDGEGGWYAGGQLGHARFVLRQGATLKLYAGRVAELAGGLNGEAGVVAHLHENVSHYDYQEVYLGLLGERWTLRAFASPDLFGAGQASLYTELGLRWPLVPRLAALGHVGFLQGWGAGRVPPTRAQGRPQGRSRADVRLGMSWALDDSTEVQLAWTAAGRGGPYTWTDTRDRSGVALGLTIAH